MFLRIVGCDGGPAPNAWCTSFLINGRLLIDAGCPASRLTSKDIQGIDTVLLTHAHWDHIKELPFLPPLHHTAASTPLIIAAPLDILTIIQKHVFIRDVWLDFSQPLDGAPPLLRYMPLAVGQPTVICGLRVTAVPGDHHVPCYGYLISDASGTMAFTSDTGPGSALWPRLATAPRPLALVAETSYPDGHEPRAIREGHLTPSLLNQAISSSAPFPDKIFLTHLKPEFREQVLQCVTAYPSPLWTPLTNNDGISWPEPN